VDLSLDNRVQIVGKPLSQQTISDVVIERDECPARVKKLLKNRGQNCAGQIHRHLDSDSKI
jgi:hypothetical protein